MKIRTFIVNIFIPILILPSSAFSQQINQNSNEQVNAHFFNKEQKDFSDIQGHYWYTKNANQSIQLYIRSFSKTRMKGELLILGKKYKIDSKVWISKIAGQYKFEFSVTPSKDSPRFILFVDGRDTSRMNGYYFSKAQKESMVWIKAKYS